MQIDCPSCKRQCATVTKRSPLPAFIICGHCANPLMIHSKGFAQLVPGLAILMLAKHNPAQFSALFKQFDIIMNDKGDSIFEQLGIPNFFN